MKVIAERLIPYLRGRLEQVAGIDEIHYIEEEEFTPDRVRDADTLLVRTRIRCNAALLEGSRVKTICTGTIGMDHIDLNYCAAHGIKAYNAPGCNAPAVSQYVFQALSDLGVGPDAVIGIIGVGHVGSIIAHEARRRGMKVLLNDPPRALTDKSETFTDLDTIAREADIVTVHTPLDASTRNLVSADFIGALRRRPVVINAARGSIVDEQALIQALDNGRVAHAVIDCWAGEPKTIDRRMLDHAAIATPHIAGYSIEGKQRATAAMLHNLGAPDALLPIDPGYRVDCPAPNPFDLKALDKAIREAPENFDVIRNSYALRHE